MIYNFDEIINRKNTHSIKWDAGELLRKFEITERFDEDTIPLFVADMDFSCPQPVIDALHKRVDQRMYGYTTHATDPEYFKTIQNWFARRMNWEFPADSIVYSPGTVHALKIAVRTFTNPGDGVIIQRPVYFPFTNVIEGNGRIVLNNSLVNNDGYYEIDFADLEQKAKLSSSKLMILCSPHNPVGRIWNQGELEKISRICLDNNIVLISDEIHGDLIRTTETFYPIANVNSDDKIIVCTATNKTFNMAGLHCSNIILRNADMREQFSKELGMQMPSPFSISALIAAYNEGEEWLEQLKVYIDKNFDFLKNFLANKMDKVKFRIPEGTYIGWMDFSGYNMDPEEIHNRIYNKANVVLEDGKIFGEEGINFQRICIPSPRSILEEAMNRICTEFKI